ncbi:MAG TPA: MFS transporter [Terriglobales bacterium]|nr:MFS transporter [Terriglobales bacterium]
MNNGVASGRKGYTRAWLIVGLLTVSTVLNYLDRQSLSILAPFLRERLQITVSQYAHITAAFLLAYSVMYAVGGWFVDRVGERIGMAICIGWWSLCTMASGLATGAMSLGASRLLLGIGEPGNYPAALKATAKWFPEEERGIPIALFSCGSSLGAVLAPPLIAYTTLRFGWRSAFLFPGLLGLVWLIAWLKIYRQPQGMLPGRQSDSSIRKTARVKWPDLFRNRNVVALVAARFLSDPVSYFCAFWIPEYLKHGRGFSMADIGRYGWIPYLAGAAGGMLGGRMSDQLIRWGMSPVKARIAVLCVAATLAPLAIFTNRVSSTTASLAILSVLYFVVFCWFINTAAIIPDIASEQLTGSILGIIGSAGSMSGFVFMLIVGSLVARTSSFNTVFAIIGLLHITAALVLWLTVWQSPEPTRASFG